MAQSNLHVAIVMDGNGRWAAARGLRRMAGHRRGVRAARRVVEAAPGLGIGTLTLFAFSSDNWKRPRAEVDGLMAILGTFMRRHSAALAARGVRLSLIGSRDRLGPALRQAVAESEAATARCRRLHLRLAIDYSARDMILRAVAGWRGVGGLARHDFSARLGAAYGGAGAPDVDLLIRTGGEQRLSDFLLWECAYAELCFLPLMWPDFSPGDLASAVGHFHTRERRFGALSGPAPGLVASGAG
ncbi:MAG TPA: polyprenyl diphosphate synthase [Candidatus Methylomirabilis sp.]|nr:polyprenyl diphosphate synthase [Candidatus Methylomirabilis sp.]